MAARVLLDSQLMDAIVKRVDGDRGDDGLEALLRFAARERWDLSGLFYLLEHFAKSDDAAFMLHAPRRMAALLRVSSMDVAEFLRSGAIRPDARAAAHCMALEQASSLDEVAAARVARFRRTWSRAVVNGRLAFSEVALLKMQLIHLFEAPGRPPLEKLRLLEDFLEATLGLRLAREAQLAVHYFCGLAGALLGTRAGCGIDEVLDVVRSTAWDLYLMRFPEMFFDDGRALVRVPFVATRETRLAALDRLMSVDAIVSLPGGTRTPVIGCRLDGLPDDIRAELQRRPPPDPTPLTAERAAAGVPAGLLDALRQEMGRRLGR